LGFFGLAIGRIVAFVLFHLRKGVLGLKALELNNHILVIGWDEQHTMNLLKLLLRKESYGEGRRVVLCTRSDIENPMPEDIEFFKVSSYNDDHEMNRTALTSASYIIIDTPDDNTTMASVLYCSSRNTDIHIIVYFYDESLHQLLKQHCPQIECTPSVSIEILAKAVVATVQVNCITNCSMSATA
jgi:voltage-gated potassium channel